MKRCIKCGEDKEPTEFYGRNTSCKECDKIKRRSRPSASGRSIWRRSPIQQRNYTLKKKYGITAEQYDALLKLQDHKCAICGEPEDMERFGKACPLSVDHNHNTGEVRGLLCQSCNSGIGFFYEDAFLLESAMRYLSNFYSASDKHPPTTTSCRLLLRVMRSHSRESF